MLRAHVHLGRCVTRSDQTREYGVTLDGEIPFPPDDPEGVLEKVAELFHLADEALAREIEREGGQSCPDASQGETQPSAREIDRQELRGTRPNAVTPKQLQFLQSLGKRKGLGREELDAVATRVVGSPRTLGGLTKQEAGRIIDALNNGEQEAPA